MCSFLGHLVFNALNRLPCLSRNVSFADGQGGDAHFQIGYACQPHPLSLAVPGTKTGISSAHTAGHTAAYDARVTTWNSPDARHSVCT